MDHHSHRKNESNIQTQQDPIVLSAALREYETALKLEIKLRNIIPGVRLIAPNNDSTKNQEDIAAAALFLGWNSTTWQDLHVDHNTHHKQIDDDDYPRTLGQYISD